METMEIGEYVKNLLEEDTSTEALEQTLIIEAKRLELEDPFERLLRSQTTLRRTGYKRSAPTSTTWFRGLALFCLSPKTMKRVRKARRRLFKASGKA